MDTLLAGHYQIVRPLGGGGFGQTFLARDSHLPGQPLCVVKQLQPKVSTSETLEIARRLFDREAETLYRLGNHPQIPRLLAHFQQEQEFYLVQEYIEGLTLDEEMKAGKRMSELTVLALLKDMLEVLSFVHQQQVIHRDIKPANLIRRQSDHKIVLIDFGAVKQVSTAAEPGSGHTSLTVAIGSPGYMPSEQQAFKPHFSSDIYAVGMVCIQALSGLSPKKLPRDAHTGEFYCDLISDRILISDEFAALLNRMVRYDYRQRYHTAADALVALEELLNCSALQTAPDSTLVSPSHSYPNGSGSDSALELVTQAMTEPPADMVRSHSTLSPLPDPVRKRLEAALADTIGPIAGLVVKQAMAESTNVSEVVDRLVKYLPDAKKTVFSQEAAALLSSLTPVPPPTSTPAPQTSPSAPAPAAAASVDPAFIKRCELELAKTIGPIAALLVKRTLAQHPQLSPTQLVDQLAQHLPPEKVTAFRQTLLASP